ncbi:hypothetical protein [Bacillus swezeyi]|uniref:Uncharacterized protein n=1 Tax=Bacillus swezeyi TaxID=1925020 RepID=A0A5M8RQ07_9BACI|nr:hypothetical protein [Bacillus swezeyi]KAA6450677.1 hypothetical protein DX927_07390 [Bacillus swezeyi]KAA6475146.1 hypothetical protein DX928_14225 [Bacillus swezeyi]TYS37211.1 hypothetical protein FZC77_07235 [Bacillus swezeyi]
MSHFKKHGGEFQGLYRNADEYLDGARDVVKNDIKVEYKYKDGIRTGYVRFMGNSRIFGARGKDDIAEQFTKYYSLTLPH